MKYIDLHTHSNISDGTLSPEELVRYAASKDVYIMALTDHDTTLGVERAKAAAREVSKTSPFELIPGIELSAAYKKRDIHILGYYVDTENEVLKQTVSESLSERDARNRTIIERLAQQGIMATLEELSEGCDPSTATITRAHFARFLMKHGYVKDNNEAFDKYLGYGCPFYVPRKFISPEKAISTILAAGGIPVLAHPLLYGIGQGELVKLLESLKEYGLKGIETYYSANVSNDEAFVMSLASKFGLIMTGGSDFHGSNKPDIEIGIGRGSLCVPESAYLSLSRHIL